MEVREKRLDLLNREGDTVGGNRLDRFSRYSKIARETAVDFSLCDLVGYPVVKRVLFFGGCYGNQQSFSGRDQDTPTANPLHLGTGG